MDEDHPLDRLATRLGASPAEVVGLALLALVGVAVVVVLGFWSGPSPTDALGEGPGNALPTLVGAEVLVHVTGEVRRPGVVRVLDGARVVDVLELAGGATVDADLGALNLARLVADGEQVVVPARRPPGETGSGAAPAPSAFDAEGRLNLNLATAADFETLPGIGPVLAERVVRHREANGGFAQVGDLRAVAGIGEKTFQSLAPLVWV